MDSTTTFNPSTPTIPPPAPSTIDAKLYADHHPSPTTTTPPPAHRNRLSTLYLPTFQPTTHPPSPPLRPLLPKPIHPHKRTYPPSTNLPPTYPSQPHLLSPTETTEPDPQIDYFTLQTLLGTLSKVLSKHDCKRYDYLMDARRGWVNAEGRLLAQGNKLRDARAWEEVLRREREGIVKEVEVLGGGGGGKISEGEVEGKRRGRLAVLKSEWRANVEYGVKNEGEIRRLVEELENAFRVRAVATQIFGRAKEEYIKSDMEPMKRFWRQGFGHQFGRAGMKKVDGATAARGSDQSVESTPHTSSTEDPCPGCVAAEAREAVMDTGA
ncbi:MAG: hypothetical protein M1835_007394 [Candelina submexicana]|nr:MAG: hypothetical protein M1835_007394 [Candelina submexicana]